MLPKTALTSQLEGWMEGSRDPCLLPESVWGEALSIMIRPSGSGRVPEAAARLGSFCGIMRRCSFQYQTDIKYCYGM